MYFWKIESLKSELKAGDLPQHEQLSYLLVSSVLYSLAAIPFLSANWMDVLSAVLMVFVVAFGTYYIYRCNGGAKGQRLLQKYVSLGLVTMIRYMAFIFMPVIIVFYVGYEIVAGIPEETGILDVIITEALVVVFYIYFGKHVKDLAG